MTSTISTARQATAATQLVAAERYAVKMQALVVVIKTGWLSERDQIPKMTFCRMARVWRDFKAPEYEQLCWLAKGLCEAVQWGKKDEKPAAYEQHQFMAVMRRKQCIAAYGALAEPAFFKAMQSDDLHEFSRPWNNKQLVVRILDQVEECDAAGSNALQRAVLAGDCGRVRALIRLGADVNVATERNRQRAPLRMALNLREGSEEIVADLIRAGADVNDSHEGISLLAHAATLVLPKLCRQLLAAGAQVEARDRTGKTPLIHSSMASNSRCAVEVLLQGGAKAGAVDDQGRTPLHYAVQVEYNGSTVKQLLDRGASTVAVDNEGNTPLHLAIGKGKYREDAPVVELLLQHKADVTLRNKAGETPLERAVRLGNDSVITVLQAHMKTLTPSKT
jgi:ankyrin repeat protein